MSGMPDVSVVMPTKNGGDRLREVLGMLCTQETRRQVELLAIDSGSTDRTVENLREHGVVVTEIPPGEFNHGATRNQAIGLARAPLVVLLTQDAVPDGSGWLEAMLSPFEDQRVAGVYCRQRPRPEADALTKRHLNAWLTNAAERRVQRMPDRGAYLALDPMERYKLCCFDDVCSAIRRSVWEDVPYEATYFAEDLDWGKRALEAGWQLVYEPRAAVVHSHDRSVWYEYKRTYLCHRRLFELFGLRTVPRLSDALRNAVVGGIRDAAYAWRHEPELGRRLGLMARSPVLALLSNLAQWRGAADERCNRRVPALGNV